MRADQSLCFKFLIEEHLVGGAEISALKVVLSGTVTQEEVVGYSILQIAFKKNSYDRWNKQSTYSLSSRIPVAPSQPINSLALKNFTKRSSVVLGLNS